MNIDISTSADAPLIADIIGEAAAWLERQGNALWKPSGITADSVHTDAELGGYLLAREGEHIFGVVRFQLEDPHYWPEIDNTSSAFLHRLAIRRSAAGQGVSTALINAGVAKAKELSREFLRLDCAADRSKLRQLYEDYGFKFHSYREVFSLRVARYELLVKQNLSS